VFGRLVEGVRGEWTFTPDGDGSVARWTWEFKPRARQSGPRCRDRAALPALDAAGDRVVRPPADG
jgi:hypothetical protein